MRLSGLCAIAALWPLIAFGENVAPAAPPIDHVSVSCNASTYARIAWSVAIPACGLSTPDWHGFGPAPKRPGM